MNRNMGTINPVLRAIVAMVIGYLWWAGTIGGALGVVSVVLALAFILVSTIGCYPLYRPLGLSTCGAGK